MGLKSIRFRMVAFSLLVFGTVVIAVTAFLYHGVRKTQQEAFDASLYNRAVDIADATDLTVLGNLRVRSDVLADEKRLFPFSLGRSLVQIRALNGDVILSSKALGRLRFPLDANRLQNISRQGAQIETIEVQNASYRLVHYVIDRPPIPPLILQLAVPMTPLENERRQILSWILSVVPLALGAAIVGGYLISTRALAPVQRIIKTAQAIQPQELSARIPVPEETELRELAVTLNELFTRLEKAFESQERFIADASHQLKSPLTILRGELDVFRKGERSPQETRALLDSLSEEASQLSKTVDDLLLLARIESGAPPPPFKRVRIDEILLEVISQTEPLARAKTIQLQFNAQTTGDADFETNGDQDLLRALFFNLVENAVKYSPDKSATSVVLHADPAWISVRIQDQGPGIAKEDRERVFDRFYRSAHGEQRVPGVGLGLSIARRIANLHGATLEAEDHNPPGASFLFRIKNL